MSTIEQVVDVDVDDLSDLADPEPLNQAQVQTWEGTTRTAPAGQAAHLRPANSRLSPIWSRRRDCAVFRQPTKLGLPLSLNSIYFAPNSDDKRHPPNPILRPSRTTRGR